jgi:hypothetical protein
VIEILTSGVALGVHVPGLLLAQRLRERGAQTEVSVLERLLPSRKLATTAGMKWAFHRDFRFALAGQRLATDPSDAVDTDAVADLVGRWHRHEVTRFVVLSGFWLPLVERYAATCGHPCQVDLLHVDSVPSPSFAKASGTDLTVDHVWLADAEHRSIPCSIPVTSRPPVAWAQRSRRLFVHGGGWGMGAYRERIGELRANGYELDVVAYEELDVAAEGVRYFMVDPRWHPWIDDGYPPFGEVRAGRDIEYGRGTGHHASFDLTGSAVATVSKPGGGTLLDSLWSATPAVLLEPFGEHERRNADLWQALGFGIPVDQWRRSGFTLEVLEEMHDALLGATAQIADYSEILVREGR